MNRVTLLVYAFAISPIFPATIPIPKRTTSAAPSLSDDGGLNVWVIVAVSLGSLLVFLVIGAIVLCVLCRKGYIARQKDQECQIPSVIYTIPERNDESVDDIPNDILEGLEEAFRHDPKTLGRVMFFLSDCIAENKAGTYIKQLKRSLKNATVFKDFAERIAEKTKATDIDEKYRQTMQEVNLPKYANNGQVFELAIPKNIPRESYVPLACFMRAVARLPQESYDALSLAVAESGGTVALYGVKALSVARKALPVVRAALITACLANEVLQNIKRWWNGEIPGTLCVKNIIDSGVGVAGGVAGGIGGNMAGAWIGAFFGPLGMAAGALGGAIAGSVIGSKTAEYLSDRLTVWIFGLPKEEALAKAYLFFELSSSASNSDINSRYRKLALEYHPDKGGDKEMWTKLQYYLAIIREARGES